MFSPPIVELSSFHPLTAVGQPLLGIAGHADPVAVSRQMILPFEASDAQMRVSLNVPAVETPSTERISFSPMSLPARPNDVPTFTSVPVASGTNDVAH